MIIPLNEAIAISELGAFGFSASSDDRVIRRIVTSSREASPDSLFIALDGVTSCGDDYLDEARARGALTLSQKRLDADIRVKSTEEAFLSIAALYKSKLRSLMHTVAITGSVGKTTAKNILSKMLSSLLCTHATEGNYNNYIGCSHTVLTAPINTEALILEIGMNHAGEISRISRAMRPTLSVITGIGKAHIGNLGSAEATVRAKLEILDGMDEGYLILPYGEERLSGARRKYTFSISSSRADCYIEPIEITENGSVFNLHTSNFSADGISVSLVGEHILNAVAIGASVIELLGFGKDAVLTALREVSTAEVRGVLRKIGGYTVLDDTYSASPEAMLAMLKRASMISGTKSAVLGDMLELGDEAPSLHELVGAEAARLGFSRLFAFGKFAEHYANGALKGGMSHESVFVNEDTSAPEATARQILSSCRKGELLLVKASHNIKADRIIDGLDQLITE